MTSTMKSEPVRSVVRTSTPEGSSSFGIIGAVADCAGKACGAAMEDEAVATNPAAPAAAPFKNLRRFTESLFAIAGCPLRRVACCLRGGSYSIDVYHKSTVAGWRMSAGQ